MLKYLFGKKKKKLPVLNRNSLSKIQQFLIQQPNPNLKNVETLSLLFKNTPRPRQNPIAVLSAKPRLNKKHTQGLTARNIQKMGYPRGPYPHVMSGGRFSEGDVELFNFLAKNIAKRKKIPYMEFWPNVRNMSYNNLLKMESMNTKKSKNNINKSVRRRAPRGLEYMYGKHNNYPGAISNYRNAINNLNTYQNSLPIKVRGALNRIANK